MTHTLLIIGAGPAAVGAALAASRDPDVRITMIDVGGQLEESHHEARTRMSSATPALWSPQDKLTIGQLPMDTRVKGLPEKRAFGSDFPFRDFGQLAGLTADPGLNDRVVSGAYGGFSNVWGAQIVPFTRATFRTWPISADDIEPHYEAILREVPHSAQEDDLSEMFPIFGDVQPLPSVSERTTLVLNRYARSREGIRRHGVTIGRARLALDSSRCVRAGLCMTGCPYSLVYSASHTLDKLRRQGALKYCGGLLATHVAELDDHVEVSATEIGTGRRQQLRADRVLLACGALGSSRIVMGSLKLFRRTVPVSESVQFMVPFISQSSTSDPRESRDFTLNQFNMAVDLSGGGYDVSHLHFYTYNPSFQEALPALLRRSRTAGVRAFLLRRLSVALGYIPSWGSPSFGLRAAPSRAGDLPITEVVAVDRGSAIGNQMLRQTLRRVLRVAPGLDLWPLLPALQLSAGGKSYHWGSTFPHRLNGSATELSSDSLGRVRPWRRIHLVDASVFPTVPATTFTLTIMANAHRIATESLREPRS